MKNIIMDGTNFSFIAFNRAKGIKLMSMKDELKGLNETLKAYEIIRNKWNDDIDKYLVSFSVQVFLNMLHKIMKDHKNSKIYLAWDAKDGASWRKEEVSEYKGNRERDSYFDYFLETIQKIENLLNFYPIYQIRVPQAEADDIIYTLCTLIDDDIIVMSTDGDMLQLPQKMNHVKVYNPVKKLFPEVPKYNLVMYKAICGDVSDNISGLPGFGPKKTIKVLEGIESLTEEQIEIVKRFEKIINLTKNSNLEKNKEKVINILQNYKITVETDKVQKMFFELKLKSFLGKMNEIKQLLKNTEKNYERQKDGEFT